MAERKRPTELSRSTYEEDQQRRAISDREAHDQNKVHQSTGGTHIGVNRHAVTDLAIYGSQDSAESLLRETYRTMKRLGMHLRRGVKVFAKPDPGRGTARLHDIIRWLDSLSDDHPDIDFFKRLHVTLCGRVTKGFLNDLTKDPHAKPEGAHTSLGY